MIGYLDALRSVVQRVSFERTVLEGFMRFPKGLCKASVPFLQSLYTAPSYQLCLCRLSIGSCSAARRELFGVGYQYQGWTV